jgi:hypothetical protein
MGRKKDKSGEAINSETGSVGSIVRVSLNDQVLQDALEIYLDETKPDALIRQQLSEPTSSWSWVKESSDTAVPAIAELLEDATHYLAGTATWSGAYASVDLRVRTCWKASTTTKSVDGDTGESHKQDDCNGSLVTVCHASARLGASATPSSEPSESSSSSKKPKKDKVQEKITSRMIERLKDDAYIAKWLLAKEPSLLYEANIMLSNEDNQLEERVDTAPDVAEAVRRAVFFAAEDSLDVLEVVLALPFLPAVKHATVLLSKNKKKTATTALADRARLRLLEDAMCDACEQQGEEDMVQDLDIQSAKKSKVDE